MIKVATGSDHAGRRLRLQVQEWLEARGIEVVDCGVHADESVDYPCYAAPVAERIQSGDVVWGVLVCGSGMGMSIAANRYAGVRAALCREEHSARMARLHNDANVLVLGERFTGESLAEAILDTWMATSFEGGRHARRVDLIDRLAIEKQEF